MDYKLLFLDETALTESHILNWITDEKKCPLRAVASKGQCTLSFYVKQLSPAMKRKTVVLAMTYDDNIAAILAWEEHQPHHIILVDELIPRQDWGAHLLNRMWQKIIDDKYPGPTISSLRPHREHRTLLKSNDWHFSSPESMYKSSGPMVRPLQSPPLHSASIGLSSYSYEYVVSQPVEPEMCYLPLMFNEEGLAINPDTMAPQTWMCHVQAPRACLSERYMSILFNGKQMIRATGTEHTPVTGRVRDFFHPSGLFHRNNHLCISSISESMAKGHEVEWWKLATGLSSPSHQGMFAERF